MSRNANAERLYLHFVSHLCQLRLPVIARNRNRNGNRIRFSTGATPRGALPPNALMRVKIVQVSNPPLATSPPPFASLCVSQICFLVLARSVFDRLDNGWVVVRRGGVERAVDQRGRRAVCLSQEQRIGLVARRDHCRRQQGFVLSFSGDYYFVILFVFNSAFVGFRARKAGFRK